jgi:hypothetical protein
MMKERYVHRISRDVHLCLVFGLLMALLFVVPSGVTHAQSRAFQMALWGSESDSTLGLNTDIAVFHDGDDQPKGYSVMINFLWPTPMSARTKKYDWARILAVLVDEPYNKMKETRCWSLDTAEAVNERIDVLASRAAELKAVAPLTRFWVNLAQPTLDWAMETQCKDSPDIVIPYVNSAYIDVISVDVYNTDFNSGVKKYYDFLGEHPAKPDQQRALIPGTFYRAGKDDPAIQASYLQGYFDYANTMNQSCNLPRGNRALTGSFDGCPVWMVMGWLAHNHSEGGLEYVGERDPRSAQIANVWRGQLAVPLRSDLANQAKPAEIISAVLPLLLAD